MVTAAEGGHADPRTTSISYIPALDGIRGVAIVVIMGFHGGVFLTSGGFYSLDTFFALSGFLITSLLITEWQQRARIRLGVFWSRRARRLLPGLLVMVLGVVLLNAVLVPAGTYPTLRSDSLSSLFYFANAVRVAGAGGAHVVLLTAPCDDSGEQPNGAPWPEDSRARLAVYNGLVRRVAATSPNTSLLNFNAMACPGGHYEEFMDGQQVLLADGVHFTFDGGNVFAPKIWPLIAKLGRRQMAHAHR
jgi:hypothetical protein